mmetsp:Transcript_60151/g.117939  ORF Transcript_60151/g.117939 Transcript_60151/m.117939 type:complete len:267 (-) Transcript_60151:608-1408(-)
MADTQRWSASHTRSVASSPVVTKRDKVGWALKPCTSQSSSVCAWPCSSAPPLTQQLVPSKLESSNTSAPSVPTKSLLLSASKSRERITGATLPWVATSTTVRTSSAPLRSTYRHTFTSPSAPPEVTLSALQLRTLTGPVCAGTVLLKCVPASRYSAPSWQPTTVRLPLTLGLAVTEAAKAALSRALGPNTDACQGSTPTNPRQRKVCHCPSLPKEALCQLALRPSMVQNRKKFTPHCTSCMGASSAWSPSPEAGEGMSGVGAGGRN